MTDVLVVDDDPVVRILVTEYLAAQGYAVQGLENGRQCLEQVREVAPDFILLDLIMPDMSGFDVLKKLREMPHLNDVPIVMLSADPNTESLAATQETKADLYLQKPFSMSDLKNTLNELNQTRSEGYTPVHGRR